MMRIILKAAELDGYLTDEDRKNINRLRELYDKAFPSFETLSSGGTGHSHPGGDDTAKIIELYDRMGRLMQDIMSKEAHIHVYSFETPQIQHGEVSRLIAKLRNVRTGRDEFIYYIQRAYELLFNLAWGAAARSRKNYLVAKTPVTSPIQNYAVHKIPDVDSEIANSVMCVMLRGALLPSMILGKELQEYSSTRELTPFALFLIKRDERKMKDDMEYVLDLEKSYFDLEEIQGRHLIFADPMNATGGSLVTIVKYLTDQGIRPASVKVLNVISALQGSLQIVRSIENVEIFTLWMDPVLNDAAFILPGLGDAGDRINGPDREGQRRNMIQLIADYGSNLVSLYRDQVRCIEHTVLSG